MAKKGTVLYSGARMIAISRGKTATNRLVVNRTRPAFRQSSAGDDDGNNADLLDFDW